MGERSRRDGRKRLGAGARAAILDRIAALERPAAPKPAAPAAEPPDPTLRALRAAVLGDAEPDTHLPQLHDPWNNLRRIPVDEALLEDNLVITASRRDPAHAAFDLLRTRTLQALDEHGWSRVAITSPTRGCGKSFTAANLAIAMARYENRRTVLLDLDMRAPGLSQMLGAPAPAPIADWLRGTTPSATQLQRVGQNLLGIGGLAVGLNDRVETYPAELLQDPKAGQVLDRMEAEFAPDAVLFDLPPALSNDDVTAFRDRYDCVLMVVGAGHNSAEQIREAVRRIGADKPVLGMVLNRAEEERASGTG
ncbi:CpsD/CapB family tyrosine-protein kinase [Limimaricola hongkongensis]|uniref:Exopolysaccharide biosynthesis domain protein n=1 Tax=Limimaricola hongkongensis DSM 17492 TaxID=1122180 RepID=A0A017HE80_9RHOB|nr:CpsD/CapB family tyrosine-protein kinase [Limimaricola hongkongensis]EYD72069.1 exopolysaccharide biosynthesis domain protein [Limimaricola hongkongensis DSM 17492]